VVVVRDVARVGVPRSTRGLLYVALVVYAIDAVHFLSWFDCGTMNGVWGAGEGGGQSVLSFRCTALRS
jgi:hypothetical protein